MNLVDRAISLGELRTLYPREFRRPSNVPSSPDKSFKPVMPHKSHKIRVYTDHINSSDLELNDSKTPPTPLSFPSSPPLSTPPLSPLKKLHPPLEPKKSSESNPSSSLLRAKKMSVVSNDSSHTLISVSSDLPSVGKGGSLSQMQLRVEDFFAALEGFVPVSLRGLQLHKSGSIDFSGVGGLETVKKSLKETLLWPSKVCTELV